MKKVLLLCILLVATHPIYSNTPAKTESKKTAEFSGSYIIDWLKAVADVVKLKRTLPPLAARAYAYCAIAYYEGVVNGMPDYVSTSGKLNKLTGIPKPDPNQQYDWPTVALESTKRVSDFVMARDLASYDNQLNKVHDDQLAKRKAEVSQDVIDRSQGFGKQIADVINAWVQTDSFEETRWMFYNPPSRSDNPAFWEPTDFGQIAIEPYWGHIRTFACKNSVECDTKMRYTFSTDPNSLAYKDAMEVYETGEHLTEEQRTIALYWADDPGETATPPGHWVSIIKHFINQYHYNLETSSYIYLESTVAMADAFITCWHTKYENNYLRPKTYIHDYLGHTDWEPFVATPAFPEFPSAHSTQSAAVATVLTKLIGDNLQFSDSTEMQLGLAPRHFNSFWDAANEAQLSRLYGGIHFRNGNEVGLDEGKLVGAKVLAVLDVKKK